MEFSCYSSASETASSLRTKRKAEDEEKDDDATSNDSSKKMRTTDDNCSSSDSENCSDNGYFEDDECDTSAFEDDESDPFVFDDFAEDLEDMDESSTASANRTHTDLASIYCPPYDLMHNGDFHLVKFDASDQNRWLIINVQSKDQFSSHVLNRDIWANDVVKQMIRGNFVFWQVYDDMADGMKVQTFYKLDSTPVVLVVDPITGKEMKQWKDVADAESLIEDLLPFMDKGPQGSIFLHKHCNKEIEIATTKEDNTSWVEEEKEDEKENVAYLPLSEEPKDVQKELFCRVAVRLPDGQRIQRRFLLTDPLQLLWSFCVSQLKHGGEAERPFRLIVGAPWAPKYLDYQNQLTFGESGLSNSVVWLSWE